jgi:hypothetical protein
MCEEFNEEVLEKWHKWLQSEEGKKVMINVANDVFTNGKEDELKFIKPGEVNQD